MTWKDTLDRLLPPFAEGLRDPPRDMLYIAPDCPPWSTTLNAALQHGMVAMMFLINSVIVGQVIGLEVAPLRDFVAINLLIIGVGTLVNGLTTRISAGHLLVHIPSTAMMTVFITTLPAVGPSAVSGGILVSGILILVLGRFIPLLRLLFPTEVMGILQMLIGISLVPNGLQRVAGLRSGGAAPFDPVGMLIGMVTLTIIVGLSVWSVGRVRGLPVLIGAAVGALVAALTGRFGSEELVRVYAQPLLVYPGEYYHPPLPTLDAAAVIPLLLASVISAVGSIACGVTVDKMSSDKWRRPDMPMIGRLLTCVGIFQLLNGLAGTLPPSISAANVGLTHVTGIAARRVAIAAGVLLMAMAFLPRITTLIVLIPSPVVGAILLYTAAYLLVSGAELILSRLLDARRRATVGLSLVAGISVLMVPELTAGIPPSFAPLLGSGLMVGTLFAVLLNQLFRIGVTQESETLLDGHHLAARATRFIEDCGASWGVRREVILRAGLAVGEVLEALVPAQAADSPLRLRVRFDELNLWLTLDYIGRPLLLAEAQPPDAAQLLEPDLDEQAFEAAMTRLSSTLIRNLADQVDIKELPDRCELRLRIDH